MEVWAGPCFMHLFYLSFFESPSMARDVFVDCRETPAMAVGRFRGTRRRAASVTSESLVFKRRLACIHGEAVNPRQESASKLKLLPWRQTTGRSGNGIALPPWNGSLFKNPVQPPLCRLRSWLSYLMDGVCLIAL